MSFLCTSGASAAGGNEVQGADVPAASSTPVDVPSSSTVPVVQGEPSTSGPPNTSAFGTLRIFFFLSVLSFCTFVLSVFAYFKPICWM